MPAYLIVFALVLSPVELPVPHKVSVEYWAALKATASALELTGPKCPWINDFESEVRWVRRHFRECGECPPLSDADRFPPHACVLEQLTANRALRSHLESRQQFCLLESEQLSETLSKTARLREIWEQVSNATNPTYIWCQRRKSLAMLRELIGREAYARGDLPPAVPWWRFAIE